MKKYCSIGGQALIEGIMMRGGATTAMAVRKKDGTIETTVNTTQGMSSSKLLKIPFVRGMFILINSMIIGVKALSWSAEFYEEPGESGEPSKFEKYLLEKLGDKADAVIIAISMILAVILAFTLFGAAPTLIINLLKGFIHNNMVLSALEGITKILVFILYIMIVSKQKEIKRVFEYHGAEHKTIHCFEAGEELTVENARKFSTLHPRCGTSFILIVFVLSIIIFTFVSWNSVIFRILLKVILFPVVAGIAYELIKWTGGSETKIAHAIRYPGLMLQKLTTKEPDDGELEIAIVAMKVVLEKEQIKECLQCEPLEN